MTEHERMHAKRHLKRALHYADTIETHGRQAENYCNNKMMSNAADSAGRAWREVSNLQSELKKLQKIIDDC